LFAHNRALRAQEAAKRAAQLSERQQGGGDLQSRAPTTTQTKEASPKVQISPMTNSVGAICCLPSLYAIYDRAT
jgi:hypothetical protein